MNNKGRGRGNTYISFIKSVAAAGVGKWEPTYSLKAKNKVYAGV